MEGQIAEMGPFFSPHGLENDLKCCGMLMFVSISDIPRSPTSLMDLW